MQMYDSSRRLHHRPTPIQLVASASCAINHNTTNSGLYGCQVGDEPTLITVLLLHGHVLLSERCIHVYSTLSTRIHQLYWSAIVGYDTA